MSELTPMALSCRFPPTFWFWFRGLITTIFLIRSFLLNRFLSLRLALGLRLGPGFGSRFLWRRVCRRLLNFLGLQDRPKCRKSLGKGIYIYIIQKTWNWQPFIAGIFLENKVLIRTRLAELDILHHGPRRPWQYGIYILCIYYLWSFHALQIFLHSSLGILRVQLGFNLLGDCLQSFDFPKPAVKNQNN